MILHVNDELLETSIWDDPSYTIMIASLWFRQVVTFELRQWTIPPSGKVEV